MAGRTRRSGWAGSNRVPLPTHRYATSHRPGSNRRPALYEGAALPTELRRLGYRGGKDVTPEGGLTPPTASPVLHGRSRAQPGGVPSPAREDPDLAGTWCTCAPRYTSEAERETGIEPASDAWKAPALPLSYTRKLAVGILTDTFPGVVRTTLPSRRDSRLYGRQLLPYPPVGPDGVEPPTCSFSESRSPN